MPDRLVAIAMVKDEADIIEHTLRHMAGQVDEIIVADNGSTDGTLDLLYALAGELPLSVLEDREPGYWQSSKMSTLAEMAYEHHGAIYVLPFDADEWWWHTSGAPLKDVLVAADGHVVSASLFNHYSTSMDDPSEPNPFRRMAYRMTIPQPLPKVLVRWAPGCIIEAGNHGCVHVGGWQSSLAGVRIRHAPYRSPEQFTRKAINGGRAYEAAPDIPREIGLHWKEMYEWYLRGGEDALREIYEVHFTYPVPTAGGLVFDPLPEA